MQIYLPIAELPVSIFLVLGLSAAVGFISGMFGIGGGFLMTPLLIFLGIPAAIAVATVAPQIAAASLTGALSYWRRDALDLRLALVLLAGGVVGTSLGVMFFNAMRRLGQLELVIELSYVTLFGIVGALMLGESLKSVMASRRGVALPPASELRRPWYFDLPLRMRFDRSKLSISVLPLLAVAAGIGFTGAVLGVGGGFLLVPALIYLFRVPPMIVVGVSLFQIFVTMLAATILHAATNQSVDMLLALLLIVGGVFGAQFGARTGQGLRGDMFRLLLALLVLGVGIRFAYELTTPPDEPFSIAPAEPRG